jgi:hypothetical protein
MRVSSIDSKGLRARLLADRQILDTSHRLPDPRKKNEKHTKPVQNRFILKQPDSPPVDDGVGSGQESWWRLLEPHRLCQAERPTNTTFRNQF